MTDPALLDHFEALHAQHADPWAVESSWYETRKRQLAVAMLPERRYHRAFEPACSIGALTELLAPRCDQLLATDSSPSAVVSCRRRLGDVPSVEIRQADMTREWPGGSFDLVVLSEVGYYLGPAALDAVVGATVSSLRGAGTLLAMHWRRVASDFVLAGGDEVHERIRACPQLVPRAGYIDHEVHIDVFTVGP